MSNSIKNIDELWGQLTREYNDNISDNPTSPNVLKHLDVLLEKLEQMKAIALLAIAHEKISQVSLPKISENPPVHKDTSQVSLPKIQETPPAVNRTELQSALMKQADGFLKKSVDTVASVCNNRKFSAPAKRPTIKTSNHILSTLGRWESGGTSAELADKARNAVNDFMAGLPEDQLKAFLEPLKLKA